MKIDGADPIKFASHREIADSREAAKAFIRMPWPDKLRRVAWTLVRSEMVLLDLKDYNL
jgi:hypothetical protein